MKTEIARSLLMLTLSLLLMSCGSGTSNLTGVGTGGTGITMGTVTGFGSILIDGDLYSSATGEYLEGDDDDAASLVSALSVDLGEQLEILLDDQGNPTSVLIEPALIGTVSRVDATAGTLVVNGIEVRVNTNWLLGPVTYYAGLTGLADVTAGTSRVEIHGIYGVDAGGAYIQATRIKSLLDTSTVTRITGIVSDLGGGAFKIGDMTVAYANASIFPEGVGLSAGQLVNVWSAELPSGNNLTAHVIRVRTVQGVTGTAAVAGLVYGLNGSRFTLSGIAVDASGVSGLSLTNGQYVVAIGTPSAATGELVASSIRTTPGQNSEVELKGTITAYDSSSRTLVVRGVPLSYDNNTQIEGVLAVGAYVEVHGEITGSVVLATEIKIEDTPPEGGTVEYYGTVSEVAGSSFTLLTSGGGAYPATLADNVGYENGTAANLVNGVSVEVQATQTASGLLVYAIEFE
jgi:hypothetical protein